MVLSLLKFLNNICDTCVICKLISEFLEIKTHMYMLSHFSHFQLGGTLWTVACQAPLSMWFSKQEYWSGLPCPLPRDLPIPGIEPMSLPSPASVGRVFTTSAIWEATKLTYLNITLGKLINLNPQESSTGIPLILWGIPLILRVNHLLHSFIPLYSHAAALFIPFEIPHLDQHSSFLTSLCFQFRFTILVHTAIMVISLRHQYHDIIHHFKCFCGSPMLKAKIQTFRISS